MKKFEILPGGIIIQDKRREPGLEETPNGLSRGDKSETGEMATGRAPKRE